MCEQDFDGPRVIHGEAVPRTLGHNTTGVQAAARCQVHAGQKLTKRSSQAENPSIDAFEHPTSHPINQQSTQEGSKLRTGHLYLAGAGAACIDREHAEDRYSAHIAAVLALGCLEDCIPEPLDYRPRIRECRVVLVMLHICIPIDLQEFMAIVWEKYHATARLEPFDIMQDPPLVPTK